MLGKSCLAYILQRGGPALPPPKTTEKLQLFRRDTVLLKVSEANCVGLCDTQALPAQPQSLQLQCLDGLSAGQARRIEAGMCLLACPVAPSTLTVGS